MLCYEFWIHLGKHVLQIYGTSVFVITLKTNMKSRMGIYSSFYFSYGDPQKRERVFIVAWKLDLLDFVFPEATHGEGKEQAIVTVSKALYDLSKVEPSDGNGTTVLTKDGDTFLLKNHCIRRTKVSDPVYLQPDEPSNTVIRKGNIMHYEQNRSLTTAEKAQLFSFPYNFQFCGAEKHHIDGIGNAVPVKMARAVALALALIYGIKQENISSES